MKISYDGPPDFDAKLITIHIELQPSEVAEVINKLISPGTPMHLPEPPAKEWKSGGGAGQWNG